MKQMIMAIGLRLIVLRAVAQIDTGIVFRLTKVNGT